MPLEGDMAPMDLVEAFWSLAPHAPSGNFIWALRQAVDTLFRQDTVYMESSGKTKVFTQPSHRQPPCN
jgi:hypothetical protein